jgi:endonuclease/exonuclease/phosphatase family metal-dependent hydrolase
MRLVSYNIQYSLGRDGRYDIGRIAETVRGADIIALQEVERFYKRSGDLDQPAELARRLPDYHWIFGPALDLDASSSGSPGGPTQRRRQFGNMVLSRLPIVSSRNLLLPKFGTVAQFSMQRTALETTIVAPSGPARIYSIHLDHLADEIRAPQVDAILDIHARTAREGGAWTGPHRAESKEGDPPPLAREAILMGDFNFAPTSPLYQRIVGPLSPIYGRLNNVGGFIDAWVAAGHGEQEGATCNNPRHEFGHRIDFCFVTAPLAERVKRAWIDDKAAGSDHQPIWTEIDL